jgi:type IV secretion system protein VirB1
MYVAPAHTERDAMFGMELMDCPGMAVPREVMHHVVQVESSFNPYAIGVVGGRLARQPRNLHEAVATARMLEKRGYNFSLGLAQVNRYNLARQGLATYEQAFQACPNLQAGSRILAECHGRSGGSWGRAFSCYYSGNFVTGYRHGYVQKVLASMNRSSAPAQDGAQPIDVFGAVRRQAGSAPRRATANAMPALDAAAQRLAARIAPAVSSAETRVTTPPVSPDAPPSEEAPVATIGRVSDVSAPPGQALDVTRPAATAGTPPNSPSREPAIDAAFVF